MTESAKLLPSALRERSSFVLIRLAAVVRQHCVDELAAVGLSQHQHGILCCLAEFGPAIQKDIAARLGIDAGDIVAFIDGLEQAGLVTRTRDPRDRRRQILTVTEAGERLLRDVEERFDKAEPGPLTALTPGQRADLVAAAVQVLAQHAPDAWTARS